ncbi:MAG TPA: hypothetical protein DGZ24_03805 [Rhodospirillaceae bacterium]|nr:hypothetical protein [Candidatus Neomarinimicrobiota bacterium]HCX14423.1 hypothetical protein [Rhodospirillaceae bacterium]
MTRASAIAAVSGALGAVLLVAAMRQSLFGVALGAMLSPLPLAMAVLGLGVNFLPVAVVSGAITVLFLTGSVAMAGAYLIMDAAPISLLSRLRAIAKPDKNGFTIAGAAIGRLVCFLVIGATIALVIGLTAIPNKPDGIEVALQEQLRDLLAAVTSATIATQGSEASVEARDQMLRVLSVILPPAIALHWCLRSILSTSLAQIALSRMKLGREIVPEYRQFTVPRWFAFAASASIVLAMTTSGDVRFVATSAAAVLSLPLALQGLAVVHCAVAQTQQRTFLLVMFYIFALLMSSVAAVLLVSLGIIEQFFEIRARYYVTRTGGK